MAIAFQWMSVTKARVPQNLSEIFNGSGWRDLQQDRSKILGNRGENPETGGMHQVPNCYEGYGPVQYHLRTKTSHECYLFETIYR